MLRGTLPRLVVAVARGAGAWKAGGGIHRSITTGIVSSLPSSTRSIHQRVVASDDFMMQQQREKDMLPSLSSSAAASTLSSSHMMASSTSSCMNSSTGLLLFMEDNIAMEECVARSLARLQEGNVVPLTQMEKILEEISASSSLPLQHVP
jgi:hypothetical protein